MKKLIAAAAVCVGAVAMGPGLASASSPYPPSTDDPGSVSPVPDDALPAAVVPGAGGGSTGGSADATLPVTGGDNIAIVQLGAVTLGVGAALAGGAAFRRRRLAGA